MQKGGGIRISIKTLLISEGSPQILTPGDFSELCPMILPPAEMQIRSDMLQITVTFTNDSSLYLSECQGCKITLRTTGL